MKTSRDLLFLFLSLLAASFCYGQNRDSVSNPYSLNIIASGGLSSSNFERTDLIDGKNFNAIHPGFSLRLMFHPDHLLSIGLASAYYKISDMDVGTTGPGERLSLNVVPLMLYTSMEKYGFEAGFGFGSSFYYAMLIKDGQRQMSSTFELCYLFSGAYNYYFFDDFAMGFEVNWLNIAERQVFVISPQLRLKYTFHDW